MNMLNNNTINNLVEVDKFIELTGPCDISIWRICPLSGRYFIHVCDIVSLSDIKNMTEYDAGKWLHMSYTTTDDSGSFTMLATCRMDPVTVNPPAFLARAINTNAYKTTGPGGRKLYSNIPTMPDVLTVKDRPPFDMLVCRGFSEGNMLVEYGGVGGAGYSTYNFKCGSISVDIRTTRELADVVSFYPDTTYVMVDGDTRGRVEMHDIQAEVSISGSENHLSYETNGVFLIDLIYRQVILGISANILTDSYANTMAAADLLSFITEHSKPEIITLAGDPPTCLRTLLNNTTLQDLHNVDKYRFLTTDEGDHLVIKYPDNPDRDTGYILFINGDIK